MHIQQLATVGGPARDGGSVRRHERRRRPKPDSSSSPRADDGVVLASVLDALPSPTLLLAPDGTVLLANSGWTAAAEELSSEPYRLGVGGNYFALLRSLGDDVAGAWLIEDLRKLSAGHRDQVAADHALPHPSGTRWYH